MIRLVIAQLASRWGQAVLLLALSAAATAAAVSAPVYAEAGDRAVVAAELAAADRDELSVSIGPHRREWSPASAADPAASLLAELDGFEPFVTVRVPVSGWDGDQTGWLEARQDLCAHVVVHQGRCPVANREAALSPARAAAAGLRPGDEVVLQPLDTSGGEPAGPPAGFTVVGLIEPADPDDPYWGPRDGGFTDAVHTTPGNVARLEHRDQLHTVVGVLVAGQVSTGSVPAVRAGLDRMRQEATRLSPPGRDPALHTEVPVLLDRISDGSEQTRRLLPVVAAPLVGLCWFVLYLAAGQSVAGRRPELGAVAVRGAPARVRASLAGTELVLPVLAGAPLGVAAGHVGVAAVAGGGVPPAAPHWAVAAVAAAGSLVAVLLALRRELTAPTVALLRWVPPRRRRRWVVPGVEVLTVALAVTAVVQLRAFDGHLVGITALAPALVMLAVAVLATRLVWPSATLVSRRALRHGRLHRAVAAVQLARRPATSSLLVVFALVLGMLGFAAVATDVAAQQRAGYAERVTGAARVLEVDPVDRGRLLDAVRRTDPHGRYAMAVVVAPGSPSQPPWLAVDSARLERVAVWRTEYGEVGQLADLLRPPAPEPLRVRDGPLAVELSVPAGVRPASVTLSMTLVSRTGERPVVRFGPLPPGREVHRGRVSGCSDGCRLAQLSVSVAEAGPAAVTWHGLEQAGRDMVPEGWRNGRWREAANPDAERISLDHTTAGVTLSMPQARPGVFYRALPPDAPYPLPVVTAGEVDEPYLVNVDNQPVSVSPVARLAGLPRLGGAGVLMDLEYAERSATAPGAAGSPEVWLSAGAPADVADQLAARGLTVRGERTVAGLRELLDGSGPAVALRYHLLAAGTAALVGLMALVQVAITDRGGWIVSLRRLRVQGVPRHTVTASVLWSYGGLVILGTVLGVLAAAAGWLATGDRLPLGVETLAPVRPQWSAVLAPWLAAVALLAAGGAAAAAWQHSAVTGKAVP